VTVNPFLPPFEETDDERTEIFDQLLDIINDVTTTGDRAEVLPVTD
jgi:hypothetical protein